LASFSIAPPTYNIASIDIEDGKTELHRAVINKNVEKVKSLLSAGAAVNVKDNFGNDPLHYAATEGVLEPVTMLLQFGAPVNSRGRLGRSPLHLAVAKQSIVRELLKNGARVSSQDDEGDTPLHLALSVASFYEGYADTVIHTLVRAGSNLNLANKYGLTPFHKLLGNNYNTLCFAYIAMFLNSGASISRNLPNGNTPFSLFLAKSNWHWAYKRPKDTRLFAANGAFQGFINQGANPLTCLPNGETLVMGYFKKCLSERRTEESLAEFLCSTVDVGLTSDDGTSILHELCLLDCADTEATNHDTYISLLLKRGADPNLQNRKGRSPFFLLFIGTKSKVPTILKAMLEMLAHGADSALRDHEGNMPICEAARILTSERLKDMLRQVAKRVVSETQLERRQTDSWAVSCRHAFEVVDWAVARELLDWWDSFLPQDVSKTIQCVAFAMLAEKHVKMTENLVEGNDSWRTRSNRIVGILRDCRERDVVIEMALLDYLLKLC
jgi:ankyrin repeat protein